MGRVGGREPLPPRTTQVGCTQRVQPGRCSGAGQPHPGSRPEHTVPEAAAVLK